MASHATLCGAWGREGSLEHQHPQPPPQHAEQRALPVEGGTGGRRDDGQQEGRPDEEDDDGASKRQLAELTPGAEVAGARRSRRVELGE